MTLKKVKLHYSGSKFWLIFWAIIYFPLALVLLATSGKFELDGTSYAVQYDGSRGWICFWTLVFFPIAIILALINGFSVSAS